jgi:cytochrome c oxidase assembly factor CtaG
MHTLAVIASAWRWNFPGLVCCGALLAAYAVVVGFRISRTLAWFLAGDGFLAVVVCSPLDVCARQYLFTAESIEQALIGLVATYLLVRGTPEEAVRHLRLDRFRLSFYYAWIIGMVVLTMWHLPRVLNAALSSDAVRGWEYASLLAGGAIFWWPLHSPLREQRVRLAPTALFYLAAATIWCSILGLFVAFAQPGVHYLNRPDTLHIADSLVTDWSFTAENDQQTAGLLFWIGAASVLLTEVMLVFYRWYNSAEVRNEFSPGAKPVPSPPRPGGQ